MAEIKSEWRKAGKTIGLVPTMGFLHRGHRSLIERARRENDCVIVSDFLNPIQFGPSEDLSRYPRDLDKDMALTNDAGADVLFYPTAKEMFGEGVLKQSQSLTMVVPPKSLTNKLCGLSRPGHFEGVCTVVAKLFNITEPDRAYFGQKDAQQLIIIKRMVADLNRPIEIIACETQREDDGLAMSSRNVYLNANERQAACILSKSLNFAKNLVKEGNFNCSELRSAVIAHIETEPLASIDYAEIVDKNTLEPIENVKNDALVALAVFIGEDIHRTRLIDNILL